MSYAVAFDSHRLGARLLTIALIGGIALLLWPYIPGLLGAAVLHVVARPLLSRLRVPGTRRVAAFVTVVVLFMVLVLPGAWVFAEAVGQIPDAIRSLQASPAIQRVMTLRIGSLDVGPQLGRAASEIFRWGSSRTMGALGGLLASTINLVIALFGTYYLLTSGEQIWARLKALLPFGSGTSELLLRRFHRVTEAMLLGVFVAAAAQGTLVGLGFVVLGLPQALFWGAVTACVSILPMFGSALVWLPASLFLAAQQRHGAAIGFGLFGLIVVSNIDNVLRLIVYRRVSQIHPMITLVGAFAGMNAFGLVGLVLGPLVLSYATELAQVHAGAGNAASDTRESGRVFPVSATVIPPTSAPVQEA